MSTFRFEMTWQSATRMAAEKIVRVLHEAGHQALFAGGCVRDSLMNQEPSDYDVATSATPEVVTRLFRITRKVGAKFGVVLVRSGRHWIEVATFRKDLEYQDGRHPTEVAFTDAREDAVRRDFTVNGMFYDPLRCELVDYVGGRNDIQDRVIRAIGDPSRRFAEDHLRMLRAVRFASRLKYVIEPVTWGAIKTHAAEICRISPERIREELEMMLDDSPSGRAFEMLCESGLLVHLFPGAVQVLAVKDFVMRQYESLSHVDPVLGFAILFLPLDNSDVKRACQALRFSNRAAASVRWLVEHQHALDEPDQLTLADLKLLMAHADFPHLMSLFESRLQAEGKPDEKIRAINARLNSIGIHEITPPPLITGEDLEKLGLAKGPVYKRILEKLYYRQLNLELTDESMAKAAAKVLIEQERHN